jgi:hypothetical protein
MKTPDVEKLRLEDLFTVRDVLEVIDQKHAPALIGKGRYRDQYKLTYLKLGNTLVFKKDEAKRMGTHMAMYPRRGGPLSDEEQEQSIKAFEKRFARVSARVASERSGPVKDYCSIEVASKILKVKSREGVYWNSDFRNGKVRTVLVGRTHLYHKDDLAKVAEPWLKLLK